MGSTNELVVGRFDLSTLHANEAIESAYEYMDVLSGILDSLVLPVYDSLDDIDFPEIPPLDFNARPSFTAQLEDFPTFDNVPPAAPVLQDVPDIEVVIPTENIEFTENIYTAPAINIGNAPENNVNLVSLEMPTKPSLPIPEVPMISADILMPSKPVIDLPVFDSTLSLTNVNSPGGFSYTPEAYNSDIRVPLFAKILYDLQNGGTGLDVTVEEDIYARGRERQRVENERAYRNAENKFSSPGFELPSGALNSSLTEVDSDISRKNTLLNIEITINQADLAQKNTHFTTEQSVQLEGLLVEFYNNQENRSLDASKAMAQSAIEIFNALVSQEQFKLERYQAEAAVFEQRVRAQLVAVEIYKTEIEGAKATAAVQESRVNIYNAQMGGLETIMKLYATEMESVKIHTETQLSKIELFKAETEAFVAGVGAEQAKVEIFSAQIDSEKTRAGVYGEKVKAFLSKLDAAKTEAEIKGINSENILKSNQLKIDEFGVLLNKYTAEIEMEIKNAQLQVEAFKTEAMAFEAETNAVGMEYEARMKEGMLRIDYAKAELGKQLAVINSTKDGYIALKSLQEKGTEGIMNTNAQLAASAMNAVNVSASQSAGGSESDGYSEIHSHTYKEK